MSSGPNTGPTWYDILGVPATASSDEIKAAWRDATDKFEPGGSSTQFRLFNEAADVLLNADRRAAYDADLGVAAPVAEAAVVEPGPVVEPRPFIEPGPVIEPAESGLLDRLAGSFHKILLICVPLVLISLALVGATRGGLHVGSLYLGKSAEQVKVYEAGKEASAAAERALAAVLAYDYRHMDADRDRALKSLTPAYGKKFSKTFTLLTVGPDGEVGPAVKTKTVVTVDVLGVGVMDAEDGRVRVVAFVNQNSVKASGSPAIFQNRVVATMVHRGDSWLIDEVKTY